MFPPLLLSLIGLTVGLIWAWPYNLVRHTYPISTFYSESLCFALFVVLTVLLMIAVQRRDARQLQTPRIALMPLGFLAVVLLQKALIPTELPTLQATAVLYGLAMLAAVHCGFWAAQLGWRDAMMRWSAAALTIGGLYAVGAQLMQAFHLEPSLPWLVAQYTVKVARRLFGNMYQPNHLATYLSLASAGAFYLWYLRRLPGWAWVPIAAALDIGIALTASRTPWLQLGLLAAAGLWMVWLERAETPHTMRRALRWWVPVAILPLMAVMTEGVHWADAAFHLQLEGSAMERLQQAGQVSGRLNLWRYGWGIFEQHWLFGAGWSNYLDAQFALASTLGPVEMADNAHNAVLDMLAKGGIIGVIMVFVPLLFWCVRAVRGLKSAPVTLAFILLGMLAVHAMLEYPQHYAFFLLPAMFLLGFAETRAFERIKPAAVGTVNALIAVLGCVMLVYLHLDYRRAEVAYRAGQIEAYRSNPARFFAPYGDYAVTGALQLDRDSLDEKLAAHRQAMALGAGATMIKRYVVLLALAGRDDEALEDVRRLKNYNSGWFDREYAALVAMCRAQGEALKPFTKKLTREFGPAKGVPPAEDDAAISAPAPRQGARLA
ncbi:polymerase [Pandoraea terrae]|uniref:Polymerase n=1 Tax=Pandoraea terrae TaxID=1537710 RepID=A0A5E4TRY9_9BURK|nr:O-antigen ligase family protein [Pandoraea terrae]VVD88819.1 polymerase [Pandoraea terrae]